MGFIFCSIAEAYQFIFSIYLNSQDMPMRTRRQVEGEAPSTASLDHKQTMTATAQSGRALYKRGEVVLCVEQSSDRIFLVQCQEDIRNSDISFSGSAYYPNENTDEGVTFEKKDEAMTVAAEQVVTALDIQGALGETIQMDVNEYQALTYLVQADDFSEEAASCSSSSSEAVVPKVGRRGKVGAKRARAEVASSGSEISDIDKDGDVFMLEGGSAKRGRTLKVAAAKTAVKKQRVSSVKSKAAAPTKKAPARSASVKAAGKVKIDPNAPFILGLKNDNVTIAKSDPQIDLASKNIQFSCCKTCTARNVHRAIATNDLELFKKCIHDSETIASLNLPWSKHVPDTPFNLILKNKRIKFLEYLMRPEIKLKKDESYITKRQCLLNSRSEMEPILISYQDPTGFNSYRAYAARTRKIQISRANRQGNNAFCLFDPTYYLPEMVLSPEYYFSQEVQEGKISWEMYKVIEKEIKQMHKTDTNAYTEENLIRDKCDEIYRFILGGQYKIAEYYMKVLHKFPGFGFNDLHYNVLRTYKAGDKLPDFKSISVAKKANIGNRNLTPLHFAAINPDGSIIKKLLDSAPDFNLVDTEMIKPIHLAALCEGPGPLQALIDKGANLTDIDISKNTVLHYAAKFNRTENIKIILRKEPGLLNKRNNKSKTAQQMICEHANLECIKFLIEELRMPPNKGAGPDRMSPLHYAAAQGNYDIAEWLLKQPKVKIMSQDKFKRTPLILSVMNGQLKLASLLLKHGSDWMMPDSSENTPLHYAVAYGWPEITKLLIDLGANPNAHNSWKTNPLTIALLKGHLGCANILLDQKGIDVTCFDEEGQGLISIALAQLTPERQKLVQRLISLGADPKHEDFNGLTPLHQLAKLVPTEPADVDGKQSKKNNEIEIQKTISQAVLLVQTTGEAKIAKLLLSKGAKITASSKEDGSTPIGMCISNKNSRLLDLFSTISINDNSSILHQLADHILRPKYQQILLKMLTSGKPTKATMNCLDHRGMTPLLSYLHKLTSSANDIRNQISNRITYFTQLHGKAFSKYSYDIDELLDNRRLPIPNNKQAEVSTEKATELREKFMKLFLAPFLAFMDKLVSFGADPQATVGTTGMYRRMLEKQEQIDKRKGLSAADKKKLKSHIARQTHKEIVIMRLQKYNREYSNDWNHRRQAQQRCNFLQRQGVAKFSPDIPEKFRYNTLYGKKNAFHFLIENYIPEVFDSLKKWKVDTFAADINGRTALHHFSSKTFSNISDEDREKILKLLISNKKTMDAVDCEKKTAFLNFFLSQQYERAETLLKAGANVNHLDQMGNSALKMAVLARNFKMVEKLLKKYKASPNLLDASGRNVLHHALNNARTESNFLIENLLIEHGVDKNKKDVRGRVPLHYAFVKIGSWNQTSAIDPIEQITGLCSYSDLQVNVADKWKKTPLHYAAQRGALISSVYLLKQKTDLKAKDIYGNTPLGVAVLDGHYNFAAMLMQSGADGTGLVYKPDHEAVYEKVHGKKKAKPESDEDDNQDNAKAEERLGEKDGDDAAPTTNEDEKELTLDDVEDCSSDVDMQSSSSESSSELSSDDEEEEEEVVPSLFNKAIEKQQFGLAYLILDQGYNYMKAIQDAFSKCKFDFARSLLSKTHDKKVLLQKTVDGETLCHILCKTAYGASREMAEEILAILHSKGIDIKAKDTNHMTALHYTCKHNNYNLASALLKMGADPKAVSKSGDTPFSLIAQNVASLHPKTEECLFRTIVNSGGDINQLFLDASFKSDYDKKAEYKTTALIKITRRTLQQDYNQEAVKNTFKETFDILIKQGAKLNVVDSDHRDIVHYLVQVNAQDLLAYVLTHGKKAGLDTSLRDSQGKSAVHLAVTPNNFASFEDIHLLLKLKSAGYNMTQKDKSGLLPIDYAARQQTGVLYNFFIKHTKTSHKPIKTKPESKPVPQPLSNFHKDAEAYIKQAQKKIEASKKPEELGPQPDRYGHFPKSYSVFKEGDKYWDVYMTKVDIKDGRWGKYVFYKIQLLYDSVRDLYIVFTRWGRIGDSGQNQRTPFSCLEEAQKDFCLIFKQKSMNDFLDLDNFERATKKYDLTKIDYKHFDHRDLLKPFGKVKSPASKLPSALRKLFDEISSYTLYERAMTQFNSILPITGLKKSALEDAMKILVQLQKLIQQDQELQKTPDKPGNVDKLKALREEMIRLSNDFYQLVPMRRDYDEVPQSISETYQYQQAYNKVRSLMDVEMASKILLGAHHQAAKFNPTDYVYSQLGTRVTKLSSKSTEYQILLKYIQRSVNKNPDQKYRIFEITRKGELERAEAFKPKNSFKKLLFHGSKLYNFISILSQGLEIQPYQAHLTGSAFGRGIYFADQFAKALQYAQNNRGFGGDQDSSIVLLCEVELGKCQELFSTTKYQEKGMDSTHVISNSHPDPTGSLYWMNGTEVPCGRISNRVFMKNMHQRTWGYDEYIVKNPAQVQLKYMIQIVYKKDKKKK